MSVSIDQDREAREIGEERRRKRREGKRAEMGCRKVIDICSNVISNSSGCSNSRSRTAAKRQEPV